MEPSADSRSSSIPEEERGYVSGNFTNLHMHLCCFARNGMMSYGARPLHVCKDVSHMYMLCVLLTQAEENDAEEDAPHATHLVLDVRHVSKRVDTNLSGWGNGAAPVL